MALEQLIGGCLIPAPGVVAGVGCEEEAGKASVAEGGEWDGPGVGTVVGKENS